MVEKVQTNLPLQDGSWVIHIVFDLVVNQKWFNQFVPFVDVYKEVGIGNKINLRFPAEKFDILIRQYFFVIFRSASPNLLSYSFS